MPWREVSVMDQRAEFVGFARQGGTPHSELCRRFGISAKTGYKWLERAADGSADWAEDRSRRPHTTPGRTEAAIEAAVLAGAHPQAGGGGGEKQARSRC